LKVADLAVAFPQRWESYAENTVMRWAWRSAEQCS
jgi:hypothetical protein